MEDTEHILFIPPVHWNYYPYRDQELPTAMARRGYSCIYLNPVRYKGHERAMRFHQVSQREAHPRIRMIERTSPWKKSLFEWLRETILNIRAVRKFRPGAVISSDHLMSLGTCIYCRLKGIRYIFDVTDHWELVDPGPSGKLYKYILKPLLARFSFAVTCTSQRQFDYFSKHRKRHTYLIPNGINPRLLEQLERGNASCAPDPAVNFIGSLRDWYDFDLLFEVFREFPQTHLHIYGLGPLYADLLERAGRFPNIHVHGNIDPSKTASLLQGSLFGILPLKINELNQSTCPIKLFDYWGASRAVISSPVEEVARLGGDALLYAATKEEFADRIQMILNDEELAKELGLKGKQKVDATHNYTRITDQFINILNAP